MFSKYYPGPEAFKRMYGNYKKDFLRWRKKVYGDELVYEKEEYKESLTEELDKKPVFSPRPESDIGSAIGRLFAILVLVSILVMSVYGIHQSLQDNNMSYTIDGVEKVIENK